MYVEVHTTSWVGNRTIRRQNQLSQSSRRLINSRTSKLGEMFGL